MKVKTDFVTNSSSASYMFVFKGDHKIDLYRAILKHEDKLSMSGEDYGPTPPYNSFTVNIAAVDIIKDMDHLIRNDRDPKDLWIKPGLVPIDQAIEFYTKDLVDAKKQKEKSDYPDHYTSYIAILEDRLELFKRAKENGLNMMCEIDFGNDGAVSTHPLGTIVRQNYGHYNNFESDELCIATEERS